MTDAHPSAERKLAVTYAENHSAAPLQGEMTWDELVATLSNPDPVPCTLATCERRDCEHKDSSQMWGPIRWRDGADRKTLANVVGVSLIGVDIDHVSGDQDLFNVYARIFPWTHFVHATHSDRPGDRCLRVGMAVSREMTATEARKVREAVVSMLELPADKRVRDPSRLYYAPTRPSDACSRDAIDGTGYLFEAHHGKVLDVDAILATCAGDDAEYGEPSEYAIPDFEGAPSPENFEAAAQAIGEAWPDDDRHRAQLALAGALARAGWPVELVAVFCARVAEIDEPGSRKHVDLAQGSARASVEKVRCGESVQGWPTVIEYTGEEAVTAARRALGLDTMPQVEVGFEAGLRKIAKARQDARAAAPPPQAPASLVQAAESPVFEPSTGPTNTDVEATLEAARRRLVKSSKPHEVIDGRYLTRIKASDIIIDPQEMFDAAIAVVAHAPAESSDDQLRRHISGCGRLAAVPDLIPRAREAAKLREEQRLARLRKREARDDSDQFFMDQKTGYPVANNIHNFDVALRRFGVTLRFDRFSRRKIIACEGESEIMQDEHVIELMCRCEEHFGFYPPKDKFYDYCTRTAHGNAFHPVVDYLDSLPAWDGVSRIESWLIRLGGVEDTPYTRAISRIVLVAAVRRVRRPGCKFDEMLILEGEQGIGKSKALKEGLCPDSQWHTDDFKLGLDTKTQMERTIGKWIVEAGELKGMSLGDLNEMKSNLTRTKDEARMAYGREITVWPRQFVFIGTTNERQYLRDQTGDRRYWPVWLTCAFDVEALIAERDMLWAEASHLDLEHPEDSYIRLAPELYGAAAEEQEKRRVVDPIEMVLDDALGGVVGCILAQHVWKILGHDDRLPTPQEQRQISGAMRSLGFEQDRMSKKGRRGTYYIRGTGPERDIVLVAQNADGKGWKVRELHAVTAPRPPGKVVGQAAN